MVLYCSCGHPILIVGHWDGKDFSLSLRDDSLGKDSPPITTCPRCSRPIEASDLAFLPPLHTEWPREEWLREAETDDGHAE